MYSQLIPLIKIEKRKGLVMRIFGLRLINTCLHSFWELILLLLELNYYSQGILLRDFDFLPRPDRVCFKRIWVSWMVGLRNCTFVFKVRSLTPLVLYSEYSTKKYCIKEERVLKSFKSESKTFLNEHRKDHQTVSTFFPFPFWQTAYPFPFLIN